VLKYNLLSVIKWKKIPLLTFQVVKTRYDVISDGVIYIRSVRKQQLVILKY